jgi:hypothetical protein
LGQSALGGNGKMELEWWLPHSSPAQFVALVDLKSQRVWFFTHNEFVEDAHQQKTARGLHFSFYTDPTARPKRPRCTEGDYEDRLIDKRIASVFGPRADDNESFSDAWSRVSEVFATAAAPRGQCSRKIGMPVRAMVGHNIDGFIHLP